MAHGIHTEDTFEQAIIQALITHGGYTRALNDDYDAARALTPSVLFDFLQTTQPKRWDRLTKIHGDQVKEKLLYRLQQEIDLRGMVDVLRKGVTDYGVKFDLVYFHPVTSLNTDSERLYGLNQLTVTNQVYYSTKNKNSLDLLLSVNGLPIVTIELKNQLTGQTVRNAKYQYRYDRDHKELLFRFKKRALVHFAVDTDEAEMTTRLNGPKTFYLPFNKGRDGGAGNPAVTDDYRTAYLWRDVWTKDSLLNIINKYVHLETDEIEVDGKFIRKEKMFFPRYHQLDVVRKLVTEVKTNGPGWDYLIQHSAGSGKSKSIAWLAYQLFSLHNTGNKRVYDAVIVITDRKVLDTQLQNTIFQIEHKAGVVRKIDKDSSQLAEQLTAGGSIIITTLQKFPFVIDKIGELPDRNYAVLIDEAHSSQGGEATKKMKEVLGTNSLEAAANAERDTDNEEDDDTALDEVRRSMIARGKQQNLSFFAFTATPKTKTLEVFGTRRGNDGKPRAYHVYSMRQAIEEGFIHDVLENYTTYKVFSRLSQKMEDDREVNKRKAVRAIGHFLRLHPYDISQKTEVIVEHFRQVVSNQIGGKAKAMVVTSSRLHAVRYKNAIDTYIREKNYNRGDRAIRTLIAFSGTVDDGGAKYTEPEMNGFGYKELPKKFSSDKYQLLLVADKYQTGFDQPLLHTMYVDKRLSGVRAVQTLSRLNRTAPGKVGTFVLDFINDRETILEAFQQYYEVTTTEQDTDPNHLYDLKTVMEGFRVVLPQELDGFVQVYFSNLKLVKVAEQRKLNAFLDPAVDRFNALTDDEQDAFRSAATAFVRLYAFLAQIMPFQDEDLEKLFAYLRFLLKKLPRLSQGERFELGDEVALEYYRLQRMEEGRIALATGQEGELVGITEAGIGRTEEEYERMSQIITLLNDKLGTDFTSADQLFFDQIEEELVNDTDLAEQAQNNSKENFAFGFEAKFLEALIGRMDQNQELFAQLMDNPELRGLVTQKMVAQVFDRLATG
jgi:type I restriction enzyme R subunit